VTRNWQISELNAVSLIVDTRNEYLQHVLSTALSKAFSVDVDYLSAKVLQQELSRITQGFLGQQACHQLEAFDLQV